MASHSKKILAEKESHITMYGEIRHAARCLLNDASKRNPGWAYLLLSNIVLTAFTFEAYMNHAGQKTVRGWDLVERNLSPIKKFYFICSHIGVQHSGGDLENALRVLRDVFSFRETFAHGRNSSHKETLEAGSFEEAESFISSPVFSDWQKKIQNDSFAKEGMEAVRVIVEWLNQKHPELQKDPIFSGGMTTSFISGGQ